MAPSRVLRAIAVLAVVLVALTSGCSRIKTPLPEGKSGPVTGSLLQRPIEHVVIFAIDGLKQDTLNTYLTHRPPRKPGGLHDVLGVRASTGGYSLTKAVAVQQAVTVFPSYTYPAWTSMMTGVFPGTHGITGNSVFLRDRALTRHYAEYHMDALKVQLRKDYLGEDMNPHIPTLYEYINQANGKNLVVHHMVVRGAGKEVQRPDFDTLWNYHRNHSLAVDENTLWRAVKSLQDLNKHVDGPLQLPAVTTIYFSGLDHAEHVSPENPEKARLEYLQHLDDLIAKFIAGSEDISRHHFKSIDRNPISTDVLQWKGLRGQAVWDRTLFILVSDHGHTPTDWDKALGSEDLKVMFKEIKESQFILEEPTILRGESWWSKFRALFGLVDQGRVSLRSTVVSVINGGSLGLFIKVPNGHWRDTPVYERDIAPVLKHVLLTLAKSHQQPAAVLYKEGARYVVIPHRYNGKQVDLSPAVEMQDSSLNDRSYPDAVRRLKGLASSMSRPSPNAPDIILLADRDKHLTYTNKMDWRVIEPLNIEKHQHFHSDHGHLSASDSLVPMIFWMGGYESREPLKTICEASIVDVTPTLLDMLGLYQVFQKTLSQHSPDDRGKTLKPLIETILGESSASRQQQICPSQIGSTVER